MLTKRRKERTKARKKGFTLMEAIVSVAVFAIAAVMFATILFTSTRMVNLSLCYDRDRELLMEAIERDQRDREDVTVTVYNPDSGEYENFTIELSSTGASITLDEDEAGDYVIYKAPSGRRFCIYLN